MNSGLGRYPLAKMVRVRSGPAGFGCDQPQAIGAPQLNFVAANAERADSAFDRGLADAAAGRYPLSQPNDPGKGINHAESVAGRTGDQQPAIVRAEVQRRVNAGSRPPRTAGLGRSASCAYRRRADVARAVGHLLAVVSARP